ncbi:MAG TPA: HAD hydrolase-like protein [Candidatus Paceibacterota bacterium]
MASLKCQPKVAVLDFSGTLFDDLSVAYGSAQEIFRGYGLPCPTLEECREEITANYMEFYYNHGFPRTTTASDLNSIRNRFYKINDGKAKIRSDVRKTLAHLAFFRIRTAIVSAESLTNLYRQLIRHGDLQRHFDFIRAEAWGEKGKEKALLDVAEVFGEHPIDMIYVDDTVDGLTSAKNVGMTPVAFTNPTGYNSESRLMQVAEFSIKEIWDLHNLIKGTRV